MSDYWASDTNVVFAYDLALQAARDAHRLAGVVHTKHEARAAEARLAQDGWDGGHRLTFDAKLATEGTDAGTIKEALIALADKLASEWAASWGQQDRINKARYVQHETDSDSWVEDGAEWIVGEEDYGAPPDDPPTPSSENDYKPTRDPMYVEFEPQGGSTRAGSG